MAAKFLIRSHSSHPSHQSITNMYIHASAAAQLHLACTPMACRGQKPPLMHGSLHHLNSSLDHVPGPQYTEMGLGPSNLLTARPCSLRTWWQGRDGAGTVDGRKESLSEQPCGEGEARHLTLAIGHDSMKIFIAMFLQMITLATVILGGVCGLCMHGIVGKFSTHNYRHGSGD